MLASFIETYQANTRDAHRRVHQTSQTADKTQKAAFNKLTSYKLTISLLSRSFKDIQHMLKFC